jgi:hypothetical protein
MMTNTFEYFVVSQAVTDLHCAQVAKPVKDACWQRGELAVSDMPTTDGRLLFSAHDSCSFDSPRFLLNLLVLTGQRAY